MKRVTFLAFSILSLVFSGCEESEGVQIGNEGVVTELPDDDAPSDCQVRSLAGSEQLAGWPGTVDEVTASLLTALDGVELDAEGDVTAGTLQLQAVGFRIGVDGNCSAIHVDVESSLDLGTTLQVRSIRGELLIDVADPTTAEGLLEATDWSGDLTHPPQQNLRLLFETVVASSGLTADVILEDCPSGSGCVEEALGVLNSTE